MTMRFGGRCAMTDRTPKQADRLLDKIVAAASARNGKGFRQVPTGKKAKARKSKLTAAEKLARQVFGE